MTPRERMIHALELRPPVPGRVPHMELAFYLTMEALGKVYPRMMRFGQWEQMSESERKVHRRNVAEIYVETARKYEHNAIFFHPPEGFRDEDTARSLEIIRELSGNDFFLVLEGDATFFIPDGTRMMDFSVRLAEEPEKVKDEYNRSVTWRLGWAEQWTKRRDLLDGFACCCDYCFNNGPFFSPAMFDEFVTPFLVRLLGGYRDMGFYTIKHTDGNIMPILDSLMAARPHALQSLDPQGHVDIAEVKRRVGKQVCLIGNVNCAMLQNGSDQDVIDSCRYALKSGMPGGGYVFSTSNCIYTGMPLKRYDLMLDVWRKEGNYV